MLKKRSFISPTLPGAFLGFHGGMEAGKGVDSATNKLGLAPKDKVKRQAKGILSGVAGGMGGHAATTGGVSALEGAGAIGAAEGLLGGTALAGAAPALVPGLAAGGIGYGALKAGNKIKDKLTSSSTPEPKIDWKDNIKNNAPALAAGAAGLYGLNKLRKNRKKKKQKEAQIMTNDVYVDGLNKVASAIGYSPEDVHTLLEAGAQELTKEASVEQTYVDGIQKVAAATGIEPEVLDEGIAMFFEKKANEEEAPKAEAQSDADEAKSQQNQEDLNQIAALIEELSEEEVKELLAKGGE